MGRWLSLAAVVGRSGRPGRRPRCHRRFRVADAQAQTTPAAKPEAKPDAAPAEAKPEAPKSDKPKPQTAKEADEALAKLMATRKPIRAATARGQTAAEAPEFKVTPRLDRIRNYPCTKCHDNKFVDRRVRELQDEHTKLIFEHGGGRFWCYDACHKGTDMDNLVSLRGRPVSYDESYKLCGQCHFQRLDWYFGGHGKRQGAWEDQREIPHGRRRAEGRGPQPDRSVDGRADDPQLHRVPRRPLPADQAVRAEPTTEDPLRAAPALDEARAGTKDLGAARRADEESD